MSSATAEDFVEVKVVKTDSWFTKARKKVARGIKRAARATWNALKSAGRGIKKGAVIVGRSLKKGLAYAGRGLAYVGFGLAWTVKTIVAVVIIAALVLVAAAVAVVGGVTAAITWLLSALIDVLNWALVTPLLWLAKGRKGSLSDFRIDRMNKAEDKVQNMSERIADWAGAKFGVTDDEGDITVTTEYANDYDPTVRNLFPEDDGEYVDPPEHFHPDGTYDEHGGMTPEERRAENLIPSARDKAAAARLQGYAEINTANDMDDAQNMFPGAFTIFTSLEDPQDDPDSSLEPLFQVTEDVRQSGIDAIDFDYSGYSTNELLAAFAYYRDSSVTIEERSYFTGRIRALELFSKDDEMLEKHGRAWALIHTQLRHQQKDFALKHVRTGFLHQVREMQDARAKADA